ncbi:HDIG family protein [Desulforapulum autotrophicum HRM2]|uniref:HDIG family protein n=1 Tax=Desulforapulum autotrophicum (strain ATCC 43914 / DSM 3382 / VKM B-1955 / HRM2) TaxID=177437 RepID=C0QFZ3_DESAH|nr:HD domain-containing protein [Desulforapulum autotrophicum]ACN15561.1 HDIG family protein [Desulforapulum autotrophicum HRM2]
MNIPSPERCLELIETMEMLSHIIDHSLMVQRVAKTLTLCLKNNTPGLNQDLILAGAILHDITKTRSFTTGEKHAQTGGALLARLGYFEVGEIVRQHVNLDPSVDRTTATEAAIVNYADKRVLHDQVVPLEQRLGYIMERYGTSPNAVVRIKRMWEETLSLEQMLFQNLEITPDRLADLV